MEKNLVILFYPKTEKENIMRNLPLAILKIGSELKARGYEVVAIDERFEENYENRLRENLDKAICVGVSAMTGYQIYGGLRVSSFVKKINRDVPVVWGGWHSSILPEQTVQNQNVDIVVRGQGEKAMNDLAFALKMQRGLQDIDGISYKKNGTISSNKPGEFQDINTFHSPNFDILEIERYIFKSPIAERTIFWSSSQGCPYQCGFCSTPAVYCRRWSGLNSEALMNQLQTLIDNYNICGITFVDDNFFVDVKRIESLCEGLIKNKINIKWGADIRVDQISRLSDDFMRLLKKSGCVKLYIGAESGDQKALDLINKKIRPDDTYRIAEKLSKHKIISEFFIMFGFPDNPKKDLERSLSLIKRVKSSYSDHQFTPFIYTPYPGTALFDLAVKKGLKIPKRLEAWQDWGILSVNTPWINKKYADTVNMYSKCFYPLAFPSSALKEKFKKRIKGFPYRILHRLAKFRVTNNFFLFPLEWMLIKQFYKLKIKFNLFKSVESFR